ncbi:MAG: hypothetical protein GX548_02245 [Lentisphaerae bacterium]|nr:hypothetical protein [Lentisphaerota bacterium]
MNRRLAQAARTSVGLALAGVMGGCSSFTAYRARFNQPAYTVTPEYFERSPRRVVVFPFAARSLEADSLERAQTCRVAFFQHFSIRDFEDVDLQALDRKLLPEVHPRKHGPLRQFADTVRWMDVVGLTSFLDWEELSSGRKRDRDLFREWIRSADEDWEADAYVLGITRGYGRFYAVVVSSIGLATHVEMRSTEDDALLWSVDIRSRSFSVPLTLDPLDVPFLLYDVWGDSWGDALDLLAYRVYRDVVATLPAVRPSGGLWVRAERDKTRLFRHPTLWTFWPKPYVKKRERLRFLLEDSGWYRCEGPDGDPVWLLRRDGTLVDEAGNPWPQTDLLGGLWKKE